MSKQIERFFNKDADSLYRMAESYLRLEDSPFEFVNSNDPNRELIFCPTHTRSAAKSEMKASVFPSGKGSILRVAMFGPWNALLPKRNIQANGFLDGLARTMPFLEKVTEDDMPDTEAGGVFLDYHGTPVMHGTPTSVVCGTPLVVKELIVRGCLQNEA